MAQNIYDQPEFFGCYSQLARSIHGLDGAPEWPAIRALLPDLDGKRVIDLGCGFGWFARWARQQRAAHVLGLDLSEKMIDRARTDTSDAGIEYAIADLEQVELPESSFDFAYSSLALHYIADLARLVKAVHRSLRPGASFVFTIEHPIYMAPTEPTWTLDGHGRKRWPVDGYSVEGPRSTDWLTKGVIKQHRTIATYLGLLLGQGFTIAHVEEWGPTDAQIAERPSLAVERQRPAFLLVSAGR
jgi:SAM-dependent methyltransferase